MELKDIVAIAGQSGLHHIVGRSKNGLIVETIGSGRRFSTGYHDKVSVLEDISVFTQGDDMRLSEVFLKLRDAGEVPGPKDDMAGNRKFLVDTIQLDSERVYDNDIRKLLTWFHALKGVLDFEKLANSGAEEQDGGQEKEADSPAHVEVPVEPKKRKTATPKTAAPKANSKAAASTTTYRPKSV